MPTVPRSPSPSASVRIGLQRWPQSSTGAGGDVSVIVSPKGPLVGRLGDRALQLDPPFAALFLPDPLASHTALQDFDGVMLRLESNRLERAAALLSDQAWSARRFGGLLREPVALAGDTPALRQLSRLVTISRLLDPAQASAPEEIQGLGLEEVLERLVVLSFWGEQVQSGADRGGSASGRESILDDLVAWIRANSHRPLHLAELEQRSGYSERSLRNAFQERFGCPPKQWIRRTRMEAARQRLLDPLPGDSVSSIAAEHGYQHVSQFSRDFRCVFGQRPSLVMRQARRTLA